MKSLLKYLKPYMKECILGPFFKFFEVCLELTIPLVTASIIDKGINEATSGGGAGYIYKMGGLMLLLGLLGLVSALTAQYFSAIAALGFAEKVRNVLFKHILKLPRKTVDKYGTPALTTRVTSDVNRVQVGVNMFLRLVLRAPFIVIGSVIMAFFVDKTAGVVTLIAVPVIATVIFLIMRITVPLHKKIQNISDKSARIIRENLIGARVVRAFVRQDSEISAFNKNADELNKEQNKSGRISALISPINTVIINLAIILVLWIGGGKVKIGSLSQGDVIALVNYLNQILLALIAASALVISFTRALASASRIEAVLSEAVEEEKIASETNNIFDISGYPDIEFKNVSFAYSGSDELSLSNISFKVDAGQTIGVIGGTGSGKSTIAKLLQRFYEVQDGEILLNSVNIQNISDKSLRSTVSAVLQQTTLFRGTIRENIIWGNKKASDDDIWKALSISQATEFVKDKEGMLDYMIEAGGRNLSGGQRQRLTIARAIVSNPKLLILDDCSSALDFATEATLRKALAEQLTDTTTVIISQRTSGISFADVIVVLDDGHLVGIGTHDELLQSCALYREIHMSQVSDGGVSDEE